MCGLMKLCADYRWAVVRVVLLLNLAGPLLIGFCISILQHLMSYPCGTGASPGDCPMPVTCDVNDGTLDWQGNKNYSIVYAWKLDVCNNNSAIITSQMAYLTMFASWPMTCIGMLLLRENRKQALTFSLALTALFALLSTLVGKYSWFVFLQALFGLAFGSVYVVPVFYILDLAGPDKEDDGHTGRLAVGMLLPAFTFFCLGFLMLGDVCVSLASDWKELYLAVTAAALICCVLVQAFLPQSHDMVATLNDVAKDDYLLLP